MAGYSESDSQLRLEAQRRLPHKNMWGLIDETMDQRRLVHELQGAGTARNVSTHSQGDVGASRSQ